MQYFHNQVFSISTKYKLRVYLNKDLRYYRKDYWLMISQLTGSRWAAIIQDIDFDNCVLKRWLKVFSIIIFVLIFIYILI